MYFKNKTNSLREKYSQDGGANWYIAFNLSAETKHQKYTQEMNRDRILWNVAGKKLMRPWHLVFNEQYTYFYIKK